MKKKITLVSAGVSRGNYSQFSKFMLMTSPGLHYVKAVLESTGYDVTLVNQTNDALTNRETAKQIDNLNPDYVLFNQFFSTRVRVAEIISELEGEYILGVGGHDASLGTFDYNIFDFVWKGEAENGLADFLDSIKEKQTKTIIFDNLEGRVNNLDNLPILKHDDYEGNVGFLVSSRGCFCQGCDFCTTPAFYSDGWKGRSVEHVAKELENIANEGKKYIFISDDNFFGFTSNHLERGNKIIKKCREFGIKAMIMTIKEQVLAAERKGYLDDWKGTVYRVFLGVENADESALLKLGKKCVVSNHRKNSEDGIKMLYDNGISVFTGYINFNPDSIFDELENSGRFLFENGMEAANFTNLAQGLRIYGGTRISEKYRNRIIDITTGEFKYEFTDKRVGKFFNYLSGLRKVTDNLDNLNYEITDWIYISQLQDEEIGKEYWQLRSQVNELNYKFYSYALNKFRNGRIPNFQTRQAFIIQSRMFTAKYENLLFRIS